MTQDAIDPRIINARLDGTLSVNDVRHLVTLPAEEKEWLLSVFDRQHRVAEESAAQARAVLARAYGMPA